MWCSAPVGWDGFDHPRMQHRLDCLSRSSWMWLPEMIWQCPRKSRDEVLEYLRNEARYRILLTAQGRPHRMPSRKLVYSEYGKQGSIPINVYTIMEDNKKCSLFPFKLSCLMQKIISTVKYWIIKWFVSESNSIAWRDKGQVVRLNTAGDWMEGYKCIFEMKSWPIDV